MKVAAITITFNRLELTKKTVESFYQKTGVDYHLFIDNGSTDGTLDYIKQFYHVPLGHNYGIAYAFATGVRLLEGYDYILKLDNDVETVTDDIIGRMIDFYSKAGNGYAVSPLDMLIDPKFYPQVLKKATIDGYNVEYVSHTGGAFQLAPAGIVKALCRDYRHLKRGDWSIGSYYRQNKVSPVYLRDLQMNHIGLNQSTPGNLYVM